MSDAQPIQRNSVEASFNNMLDDETKEHRSPVKPVRQSSRQVALEAKKRMSSGSLRDFITEGPSHASRIQRDLPLFKQITEKNKKVLEVNNGKIQMLSAKNRVDMAKSVEIPPIPKKSGKLATPVSNLRRLLLTAEPGKGSK